MLRLLAILVFLGLGLGSLPLQADEKEVRKALAALEKINGYPADEELIAIIPAFFALPAAPDSITIQKLFESTRVAAWSSTLAEYISLSEILFDSLSAAEQASQRQEFTKARLELQSFQDQVTAYVLRIHPGFAFLGLDSLRQKFTGKGIRLAVFDVFDPALLDRQRQTHPKAQILKPRIFGNPVELSHGNSVIDILLELAPELEIIPIWSDAKSYALAMQAIAQNPRIDIVNMSRAFPEDPLQKNLDAAFKKALQSYSNQGILVKALGNTGTDLSGVLNRRRQEQGLGPVNNIASYDVKLIRDLYRNGDDQSLTIFAVNLALFADDIALTATVPGSFLPVQQRTLAVPAEGVFSPSTQTFESGSSFAAPQLAAIAALLLQKRLSQKPAEDLSESRRAVYQEFLQSGKPGEHQAEEWGRGLPGGY